MGENEHIKHVGIIMDGNGRWAADRGRERSYGHFQGARVVKEIVSAAPSLGVEILTLYAFSTENWNRPEYEIRVLMRLFRSELLKQTDELYANNICARFIGSRTKLPPVLVRAMEALEDRTSQNDGLILQIAINYGGRQDIINGMQALGREIKAGRINPELLSEEDISDVISTAGVRDPDLIIRTSGEMRLSNFLLWQAAYSEFVFVKQHWPEFTKEDFAKILHQVSSRDRRFGGIKNVLEEEKIQALGC